MGTSASKNPDSSHGGREGGGQLYVSLKMENFKIRGDLVPYVYGSGTIIGSWDSSKAVSSNLFSPFLIISSLQNSNGFWYLILQLSMERESASMWELGFVVPSNHGISPFFDT